MCKRPLPGKRLCLHAPPRVNAMVVQPSEALLRSSCLILPHLGTGEGRLRGRGWEAVELVKKENRPLRELRKKAAQSQWPSQTPSAAPPCSQHTLLLTRRGRSASGTTHQPAQHINPLVAPIDDERGRCDHRSP